MLVKTNNIASGLDEFEIQEARNFLLSENSGTVQVFSNQFEKIYGVPLTKVLDRWAAIEFTLNLNKRKELLTQLDNGDTPNGVVLNKQVLFTTNDVKDECEKVLDI